MAKKEVKPEALQQVADLAIEPQSRDRFAGMPLMIMFAKAGELISPWWSKQRDDELRRFWKQVDMISGALYMMESRLTTIPWKVVAKDPSVKRHVALASNLQDSLLNLSSYGKGWMHTYSAYIEDLLSQDNGAFLEIVGEGDPEGPIEGAPMAIAHLDSWRCMRTSNWEFPVIYHNTDGKRYRLHYTRVIYESQMPSPIATMYGVGFCAISRCINVAQNLLDIMIYKQEKLGSRPQRGLLVAKGGLDPDDIREAFVRAEAQMDSQMLKRYARMVVVGHQDLPEAGLVKVDLSGVPDGFDEAQSIETGMACIALAFGVDARELWPNMASLATRAEALLQHVKQRGKSLGQIMANMEYQLNWKFLPDTMKFSFDFQDDEEDKQKAEIRNVRAQYYNIVLTLGVLDARTMREHQLADGDISEDQFNRLEARDGRLPEGTPILSLFHDPEYAEYLDLAVPDPLNKSTNLPEEIYIAIDTKRDIVMSDLVGANKGLKNKLMTALAALDELEKYYKGEEPNIVQGQQLEPAIAPQAGDGAGKPAPDGGGKTGTVTPPPPTQAVPGQIEGTQNTLQSEDMQAKGAFSAIQRAAEAIRSRFAS